MEEFTEWTRSLTIDDGWQGHYGPVFGGEEDPHVIAVRIVREKYGETITHQLEAQVFYEDLGMVAEGSLPVGVRCRCPRGCGH